ncbi:MAG TPA: AI-2E family transporter [Solirubrobacterales bacterium]|jgi:predicted PurR-regulated permease PerM|nr:AI-2E family transporter [Solirubrobacterales bacterium]
MNEPYNARALYRAVLLAAGLLVLGLLFRQLATLLIAVLMTVLISIPLTGAANRLERHRVPRAIGAAAGLLTGIGVIALLFWLLIPSFVDQTNEFIDEVPGIVDDLTASLADVTGSEPKVVGHDVQDFLEGYADDPDRFLGPLTSIGLNIAAALAAIVFIVITAMYIAIRPQPLVNGILSLVPPARREHARVIMYRLRTSWVGWMEGVVADMVISGVLLYIGLTIIGLEYAIFFAVLSALLVVIPYFGAIVGAIPPTLFALTDSPEQAILVLAIYIAVQQVEGNVLIPLIMSNRVRLHPALIAIGVLVVGQLFGFIGLFVAVPIISMAVILSEELWVKPTEERHGVRPASALEPVSPDAAAAEREPAPITEPSGGERERGRGLPVE